MIPIPLNSFPDICVLSNITYCRLLLTEMNLLNLADIWTINVTFNSSVLVNTGIGDVTRLVNEVNRSSWINQQPISTAWFRGVYQNTVICRKANTSNVIFFVVPVPLSLPHSQIYFTTGIFVPLSTDRIKGILIKEILKNIRVLSQRMLCWHCYEVRILQSHTTITFIQSQGHKDFKKSTFIIKHYIYIYTSNPGGNQKLS